MPRPSEFSRGPRGAIKGFALPREVGSSLSPEGAKRHYSGGGKGREGGRETGDWLQTTIIIQARHKSNLRRWQRHQYKPAWGVLGRLLLLSHFSCVRLCATPSLGFSRQEHWSGLPFPSPMDNSEKWKWSCSVMSDSSQPHGLQPTRFLRPWDFPGKSTGVGCHCFLGESLFRGPRKTVACTSEKIDLDGDSKHIWEEMVTSWVSGYEVEMAEGQASKHPTSRDTCGLHTEAPKWTKESTLQTGSLRTQHKTPSPTSLLLPGQKSPDPLPSASWPATSFIGERASLYTHTHTHWRPLKINSRDLLRAKESQRKLLRRTERLLSFLIQHLTIVMTQKKCHISFFPKTIRNLFYALTTGNA